MKHDVNRRQFLLRTSKGVAATAAAMGGGASSLQGKTGATLAAAAEVAAVKPESRILLSLKAGMVGEGQTIKEKLQILKDLGYDGLELNSPGGMNKEEALKASRELDFPLHGVVDSIHWGVRLSDPDAKVREKAVEGLKTAIRESHYIGGSAVLLVPGQVSDPEKENKDQVWERSIEGIGKVLPLAARLGIHILIENVWNGFLYDPDGGEEQSAEHLVRYLDEINSPWVGSYFDIGNHQKFGKPDQWIRQLGRRIVKLDVKDWGKANGFCKIGDGDVNWPEVRKALKEIGYTGWATAEVGGGKKERLAEILQRMRTHLLGV